MAAECEEERSRLRHRAWDWINRIVSALHDCGGYVCGRDSCLTDGGLRTQGPEPAGREPGRRNHELRPAAIQANPDVWRGCHGRMTQRAGTIAKKSNLCRDNRDCGRLALRANHGMHLRRSQKSADLQKTKLRKWFNITGLRPSFQQEQIEFRTKVIITFT